MKSVIVIATRNKKIQEFFGVVRCLYLWGANNNMCFKIKENLSDKSLIVVKLTRDEYRYTATGRVLTSDCTVNKFTIVVDTDCLKLIQIFLSRA